MIQALKALRTFWSNYKRNVVRIVRGPPLETYAISATEAGLALTLDSYDGRERRHEDWFIPWQDITSVDAFKSDNYTYDTIWISVSDNEGLRMLWPDDATGWSEAASALPRYLPGCANAEEWFMKVAFPAFETNHTILYKRHSIQRDDSLPVQ